MEIIIISGRSGAGKSVALRALEDMGYYCVDNLPLNLLPQLTQILANTQSAVAISLDIRNLPPSSADLDKILTDIQATYSVKIIFLDSDRSTLIRRYSDSRRLHPLSAQAADILNQSLIQAGDLVLRVGEDDVNRCNDE